MSNAQEQLQVRKKQMEPLLAEWTLQLLSAQNDVWPSTDRSAVAPNRSAVAPNAPVRPDRK